MMKPQLHHRLLVVTLLTYCFAMLSGCGYTNPYHTQNDLSNGAGTTVEIYLDMWDNKTDIIGYQATIQHDLILWLKKSNRFHITQSIDKADYILSGVIQTIDLPALTYGEFDRATTLRAEVEFSYKLTDHKTGKTIFQQPRLVKREDYTVAEDAIRTNSNLQHALKIMSEDLADNIYIQLFYLFTLDSSKGNKIIIPTDDIKSLD